MLKYLAESGPEGAWLSPRSAFDMRPFKLAKISTVIIVIASTWVLDA